MEERALLSAFVVNTTSDLDRAGGLPVGQESLRQAIEDVNADSTPDVIDFNLGNGGHQVITLASALPAITNAVTIDGTSQPGFTHTSQGIIRNGLPPGFSPGPATTLDQPLVEISGNVPNVNFLDLHAPNCVVKGLVLNDLSNGYGAAIDDEGGGAVIQGNYIGTDWTGSVAAPTGSILGQTSLSIGIHAGTSGLIGGTALGQGNLIGDFTYGVLVPRSSSVLIEGNFVGTNAAGTAAIPNNWGVAVDSDSGPGGLLVGGPAPGAGNLISGNMTSGIAGDDHTGVTIQGNEIGTDITGTKAVLNSSGIDSTVGSLIGGTAAGAGNLISGNTYGIYSHGRDVVQGNFIGTDITGTVALGNRSGVSAGYGGDTIGGTTPAARNIISGNYANIGADNALIEGNYIGTDVTGEAAVGQPGGSGGIFGADGCTIGGTSPGAGNLISGNGYGLRYVTNSLIQGNFIGTNKEGTKSIGNFAGIYSDYVSRSIGDTIGGTSPGAGNLISGNGRGIDIFGGTGNPVATNLIIQGNKIGTDVTGSAPLANSVGILLTSGLSDNLIGGTTPGSGNVIAFNTGAGLVLAGRDPTAGPGPGVDGYGNSILGNSIYGNQDAYLNAYLSVAREITLFPDPNNPQQGPNGLQAAPVLTVAYAGTATTVTGSLSSSANNTFRIEFFASPGPDALGNPEGQRYLGFVNVTTNANGNAAFTATGLDASSVGEAITATATVQTGPLAGSTSEFSALSAAVPLPPSSLSGVVFADFNNDGQVDFGE
jgi:titin